VPDVYSSDLTLSLTRRELFGIPAALALAGTAHPGTALAAERKKIAVVTTIYNPGSHSAWLAGGLLEGYDYNGKWLDPRVQIVSMYTDQVPDNDMSREMAANHGFTIYPTVRETLTLGGNELAVDGVVLIGEHGIYHTNIKGQKYYPRWYLYKQIMDVFRKSGRTIPVFTDKHLSVEWNEAKWMYDQSHELGFPLMAGSSLPVIYRIPALELELETPIEKAVALHPGGKEYAFHGIEVLQCMVERRRGGETGVAAVQCLEGRDEVWKWTDANPWAERLLGECLKRCPERKPGNPRDYVQDPYLFILEYRDGLKAVVYSLGGNELNSWAFAADISGKEKPVSTQFWIFPIRGKRSGLSAFIHYVEEMMVTGRAAYPVERTLLTTGVLASLMDSNYENGRHLPEGRRLKTPYLNINYRAPEGPLYNRGPRPVITEEK
jgi:hypothetical protein